MSKLFKKHMKWLVTGTAVAMSLAMVLSMVTGVFAASDPSYDMTTDGTGKVTQATINGAIWQTLPSTQPTGSGVFNTFLRVHASPTERGYNTDGRPLQFDEKGGGSPIAII